MKLLSLSVLLLFSVAFRAPDCVCSQISDPRSEEKIRAYSQQAFDKATAAFEGKVVALNPYTVTLRLQKRWKGPSQNEIVLSTEAVPGYDGTPLPEECVYQFQLLGEAYLVYAYGPVEKLKTDACDTFMIKDAAEEEKGLDQIKRALKPFPRESNEQARSCFSTMRTNSVLVLGAQASSPAGCPSLTLVESVYGRAFAR